MNYSEIIKLVAFVIGLALVIITAIGASNWYYAEIFIPTIPPPKTEPFQYPNSEQRALSANKKFTHLPEQQKQKVISTLEHQIVPLEEWLVRLDSRDYALLCLGEYHNEYTRQFLATHFFPNVDFDVLFLEATQDQISQIEGQLLKGKPYIRLHDADIAKVLRSVTNTKPSIVIAGVEETLQQDQIRLQRNPDNRRDYSIAENLQARFKRGLRHITLHGALHCTNKPGWLFDLTRSTLQRNPDDLFINAVVLGIHQEESLEAFSAFLDEIGIHRENFVITETALLPSEIRQWFSLLTDVTFDQFQNVIVFRP